MGRCHLLRCIGSLRHMRGCTWCEFHLRACVQEVMLLPGLRLAAVTRSLAPGPVLRMRRKS